MSKRQRHQRRKPSSKRRPSHPGADEPRISKGMAKALVVAAEKTASALSVWLDKAKKIAESTPKDSEFSLDPWQKLAVDGLSAGHNVVVDAPTTAGKTRVVETFFKANLNNPSFRAAYTTPVKSLSNDKVREFREMFGIENVGIATGDIKENLKAPIVVTTLETYRNSLLGVDPDLGRTLVIFDEYHFMQDGSRGSAWEEAIILSPEKCQLLLMSASVKNATEFVAWIEKIHRRKTDYVSTEFRPVPLENIVYFKDQWLLASEIPEKALQKKKDKQLLPLPHKHLAPRLAELIKLNLTPCIVYAGRRKSCEGLATQLSRTLEPLPEEQSKAIGEILMEEDQSIRALHFIKPQHRAMMQRYGVAYHHSGMAPPARMAIETLLKQGKLRFCVATMGLSIGINFSVRSSLISDFQRPGEGGFTKYGPSEVLQMLGRAGRRGRDAVGFSLWPSVDSYTTLAKAKRDRCDSRLKNDPTTLLGLVSQGLSSKQIEEFYGRSFMRFNDTGIDLGLVRKSRVTAKLGTKDIPCSSPVHEYAMQYVADKKPLCNKCPHRTPCHKYIDTKSRNDLAALHVHLHAIEALDENDELTRYGEIAKYFPHAGGLLVARFLHDNDEEESLIECAELMAAVALARFKTPGSDDNYRFPFDERDLEKSLEDLYPYELFPELYDPPYGQRNYPVIRELNPDAGYAIRLWAEGMPWKQLEAEVTNEKFGQGDLISLIYRVASYMQSLAKVKVLGLSQHAAGFRDELLRDPLTVTL